MLLQNTSYEISDAEIVILPFEEELFQNVINFRYTNFMLNTLYDTCKDQRFLDRLFNWSCEKLGIDIEQLKYYFESNFDEETRVSLGNLMDNQFHRIQVVTIEFLFEYLPFNYLIKVSQKRNTSNFDNLTINIRQDILDLLLEEVKKIENMNKTLDSIRENLQQKEQLKNFSTLHNASLSVSKKTVLENMYMYSIVDSCSQDTLLNIISDMMDDNLIVSNLYS